ncbi:MAG: GNAT family N-acetyltransferase [Rhizobiaceae bacterium]
MQVLVTRRLTLRPPVMADAEDIALWLSDWNVSRMLARVPAPYGIGDAESWIAGPAQRPNDMHFTIHRERLAGCVSMEIAGTEGRLGYWLAEPWQGHGFMTEAACAVLAYGFEARGLKTVRTSAFIDNHASRRVQEKLGFVVTGTAREWSASRNAMVDTVTRRMTAEAFAATRRPECTAA